MKPFFFSFVVGCAVGLLYAALRVKSPAPPLVALLGLPGMVLGKSFSCGLRQSFVRNGSKGAT